MKWLRSYWYYWYTGNKLIALASMLLSALAMWGFTGVTANFSIWAVVVAVLFDAGGFVLAAIYFLALRAHIPELPDYLPDYFHLNFNFKEKADRLVIEQLVKPVVAACIINRLSAFFVAWLFSLRAKRVQQ